MATSMKCPKCHVHYTDNEIAENFKIMSNNKFVKYCNRCRQKRIDNYQNIESQMKQLPAIKCNLCGEFVSNIDRHQQTLKCKKMAEQMQESPTIQDMRLTIMESEGIFYIPSVELVEHVIQSINKPLLRDCFRSFVENKKKQQIAKMKKYHTPTKADKLAGNIIPHYSQIGEYTLQLRFLYNGKQYQKRRGFKKIGYDTAKTELEEWLEDTTGQIKSNTD